MSQLAQEYNRFVIFRHQTICEFTSPIFSIKKRLTTNSRLKMYSTLAGNTLNDEDFSTENIILNPYYVTGFTDAEGSFLINIQSRPGLKLDYSISLSFKLKLHSKDEELLERILNFFNVAPVVAAKR